MRSENDARFSRRLESQEMGWRVSRFANWIVCKSMEKMTTTLSSQSSDDLVIRPQLALHTYTLLTSHVDSTHRDYSSADVCLVRTTVNLLTHSFNAVIVFWRACFQKRRHDNSAGHQRIRMFSASDEFHVVLGSKNLSPAQALATLKWNRRLQHIWEQYSF